MGVSVSSFSLSVQFKLLLLAVVMAGLWYLAAPVRLTIEESLLWEKVRAAQLHMSNWGEQRGLVVPEGSDPWSCGLIGVEWSGITTTLGELGSKRTACNPAWAIQFSRWFREQGLHQGDPIAIYSSSSFPGLLLNALAAAESLELEPLVIVSLGASTWGANRLDAPWPVLAAELRRRGFISKRADYYTMGGDEELGNGMSPEGQALLRKAAGDAGVELLAAANLEEMVALKSKLLQRGQAKLLVNIGGSHANLGDDPAILKLQPGLNSGSGSGKEGNGVIGFALGQGIPVLHMLNIKTLGGKAGVPYDSEPRQKAPVEVSPWWSLAGVLLFLTVLLSHRRWRLE